MANEQSQNGSTNTVLGTSQNCIGKETPLDEGSLCPQQNLGLSESQRKRKREKENRRAEANANIVLDIHLSEVTSLENHPSIDDSDGAPPEMDRNKSTKGGVSLEISLSPRKKRTKKQKKEDSSRRSDDIGGRCTKDTSLDVIPVKLDSDSEMTVHAAESTSALSMGSGNQQMCHIALTMDSTDQGFQEDSFADHCVANIGVLEKSDEHSGPKVVEELQNSKKGGSGSNVRSFNWSNIKTYQRRMPSNSTLIATASAKENSMSSIPVLQDSLMSDASVCERKYRVTYYRRRKSKCSGSHLNSLESFKESASPAEILMQNSSAEDTPMDHLEQAVGSAPSEKITGEVVATHDVSLLVGGDILMGKASGECPNDDAVSEEEKKIEIENSGETILQCSVKGDDSLGDLPVKSSVLGKGNKVEKSSILDSCNEVEVIENTAKQESLQEHSRKKLLVLDVNGILADIVPCGSERRRPDIVVSGKAVFKRPFCDDFLQFCFERFHVGVWSSRTKRNVEAIVNFLMHNSKHNLLFCWDQSHCTDTGFTTVENRDKPLVLKELNHLWEKKIWGLPWERGEYNESNTLLLDDSPYKALRNPPYTAIFPHPYKYLDVKDNCIGPGGDMRIYLEGLAASDNVQSFVKLNPFGQRPITEKNASWRYYLKVIGTVTSKEEDAKNGLACVSSATETLLMTNSTPMDDDVQAKGL